MSVLPERNKTLPSGRHRYSEKLDVYDAWLRGDLKSRDEMDTEAMKEVLAYSHDGIHYEWHSTEQLADALDAAWGVTDD